jgi:acetyl esterase
MTFQRLLLILMGRLPGFVLRAMAGGKPFVVGGRTLDPFLQLIRVKGMKAPSITTLTPEQARKGMRVGLENLQPRLQEMRSRKDLKIPVDGSEIDCRILTPYEVGDPSPMILYFHQGGCVIGDIDSCEPFCSILAEVTRSRVLIVGYRKAPEHKFPTAAEDAIAAYEYVMDNSEALNVAPGRVVVAGESAGGGLATVICQTMNDRGGPRPYAQVLIYPWVEALADNESYREHEHGFPLDKKTMEWFADLYLNSPDDAADHRVSPLRNKELKGMSRALIYTAGFDPLRYEGALYATKLRAADVIVEYTCFDGITHSFTAYGGVSKACMNACLRIAVDLQRTLSE